MFEPSLAHAEQFGSDPTFESKDGNNSAIQVSPQNFNRVCDRFGLVCDEKQVTPPRSISKPRPACVASLAYSHPA